MFGHGQADFWINVPDAVAQAVATRLALQKGQWFLDTTEGTDWSGRILGSRTQLTRDAEIRSRALLTTGATAINGYASAFNADTRAWEAAFQLDTAYGAFGRLVTPFVVPSSVPSDAIPVKARDIAATQVTRTSEDVSWTGG